MLFLDKENAPALGIPILEGEVGALLSAPKAEARCIIHQINDGNNLLRLVVVSQFDFPSH